MLVIKGVRRLAIQLAAQTFSSNHTRREVKVVIVIHQHLACVLYHACRAAPGSADGG